MRILKTTFLLLITFLIIINGLYAQTDFPRGNFWSLDAGIGMGDIMVDGFSLQFILDPKLCLSPPLLVGTRMGLSYSFEEDERNILTLESQVYLRWNFLRLGRRRQDTTNFFVQGGIGLLSAYRGEENVFDDVTMTRGSFLADGAFGVTIPLKSGWHIEPSIRGGFPHIWGISLTTGLKFPLHRIIRNTEYIEINNTTEVIKRIMIPSIEFVVFGADIGRYNVGIDRDAQQLNELVINYTANVLLENPDYRVRLEGHANPFTATRSEADDLMALSTMRANAIADLLKARGVSDEQIIIIAFGGTRTATNEWDIRNRNRRVELMIIQIDQD